MGGRWLAACGRRERVRLRWHELPRGARRARRCPRGGCARHAGARGGRGASAARRHLGRVGGHRAGALGAPRGGGAWRGHPLGTGASLPARRGGRHGRGAACPGREGAEVDRQEPWARAPAHARRAPRGRTLRRPAGLRLHGPGKPVHRHGSRPRRALPRGGGHLRGGRPGDVPGARASAQRLHRRSGARRRRRVLRGAPRDRDQSARDPHGRRRHPPAARRARGDARHGRRAQPR